MPRFIERRIARRERRNGGHGGEREQKEKGKRKKGKRKKQIPRDDKRKTKRDSSLRSE
jgi:hypothetical protein